MKGIMKLKLHPNISLNPSASRKTVNNEEILIVPAVAIREGVLNGILYPASTIKANASDWNGLPVSVTHPKVDGKYITANSEDSDELFNIGRIYNAHWDDSSFSLKVDFHINISKAELLGYSSVVNTLEEGKPMEVSTGMFFEPSPSEGEFGGLKYNGIADEYKPDHIALLPDEVGACSMDDGCGALKGNKKKELVNNCAGKCTCKDKEKSKGVWNKVKTFFVGNAEQSFNTIRESLSAAIRSEFSGSDMWPYVLDVYSNYFIYELGQDFFKQSYSIDANDNSAVFIGDPVEVKVETEYKPITNKTNMDKKKVVDLLISNSKSGFEESHRDHLMGLPDAALEQLSTNAQTEENPLEVTAPVVVTNAGALSDSDRALLDELKANRETRLMDLRAKVKKGFPKMTEPTINAMSEIALTELVSGLPAGANYAPAGGGAPATNSSAKEDGDDEPYIHTNTLEEAFKSEKD